jgi:integrase
VSAPAAEPTSTPLSLTTSSTSAPDGTRGARRHASEQDYRSWVYEYVPHQAVRWERLCAYRRFVEQWPDLRDWFAATLPVRLGFEGGRIFATGRTAAHRAAGYLVYLALVRGVDLDADYLLGRKYARLLSDAGGGSGLGVDRALFESHVARLAQLGYSAAHARSHLTWGLGRLMLYRGDPDLPAITATDLFAFGEELRRFGQRQDYQQLRQALYAKSGVNPAGAGEGFIRDHLAKLHAVHVLLFNIGQVGEPPSVGTRPRLTWTDRLLPEPCPPAIRDVIERYLRLRLEANFDRRQTVRLARQALRRLVGWLASEHPEITTLAQLDRALIEDYLRWIPSCSSKNTGRPLAITTVKHEINHIATFCRDTAIWDWDNVPGRPLITNRDSPRRPETLPRYLPDHELEPLMTAINDLDDPMQRAALLLTRWSGARRDEIRRLTTDCLDTYPGGHPRLRIPVGKGHTERLIPLHPDAATALQQVIEEAKRRRAVPRRDPNTGRTVDYVFLRRGKLLSAAWLFDEAFRLACTAAGLVDANGVPTVSAHRMRHTLGTQLAEGGARIQTIMAILGHRSAAMSVIYTRISNPEIRRQYEAALAGGARIAGPAADALLHGTLDQESLHWLQTNFLKAELELGHCLRLPAEGPCECDLVLTCPKFLTTSDYAPRLQARLKVEQQLVEDAAARGWPREVERHTNTIDRIRQLLDDLDPDPEPRRRGRRRGREGEQVASAPPSTMCS